MPGIEDILELSILDKTKKSCINNIFLFSDHVIYEVFYYENLESYDILYQVNAYLISFCFVYNKRLLSYSMHMQVVLSV